MVRYGPDSQLCSDVAQLVRCEPGREYGSLTPISQLPSGLAREVWLYRYASPAGEVQVVLAFGNDPTAVEANLRILEQVSPPVVGLFATPLALVTADESTRYVEVSEYVPGVTLSALLKREQPVPEDALRAALDALRQLHRATVSEGNATNTDESLWRRYHRPRLLRRLDALEQAWPEFVRTVRSGAFEVVTPVRRIRLDGLATTLAALDAIAPELSPRRRAVIHGDCKPENIIVEHERGARMIDAQLMVGDPLSDYAKLYYCVLTDGLLSQTHLPHASRLRVEHTDDAVSIEMPVRSVDLALATSILQAISLPVMNEPGATRRLHLCMGHVLIWQAGRLLEVALEREAASTSPQRDSARSGATLSRTAHIRLWFVLGAFHLSCAASTNDSTGLDIVTDSIRSLTYV